MDANAVGPRPKRGRTAPRLLSERLLLRVAELQGPMVDVVDVTHFDGTKVRDLVLEFMSGDSAASPAEVRAAAQEMIDSGRLVRSGLGDGLADAAAEVKLTDCGLVAARQLEPTSGRLHRVVTLRTRRGRPMLDARFETGDAEWDHSLNESGTVLAAAFVVLVLQPKELNPLFVEDCGPYFERLCLQGVRNRPGPKSEQVASPSAIRNAFDKLGKLLGLRRRFLGEDKRRDSYVLTGPLPEMRIAAGDPRHCGDWQSYRHVLWRVVTNQSLSAVPGLEHRMFPPASDVGQRPRRSRVSGRSAEEAS